MCSSLSPLLFSLVKMASSVTQTMTTGITSMMTASSLSTTLQQHDTKYHMVLLAVYCAVLLIGTISLSFMMHIMKSSTTSITSIAVLNLIFTHFIFLLTVPFRIYYYATSHWSLGLPCCKFISGMIHIHMYMSFIFYVIILITRLMMFYCKTDRVASLQKVHALIGSVVVWIVVLVVVPSIIFSSYGNNADKSNSSDNSTTGTYCFHFGKSITSGAKVVNYIISTIIIIVAIVLTALQANVLRVLYRKHRQRCTSQQAFGAQLKSLCFALIMVIGFIPYHLFRLYYLEHIDLQNVNEVFLSLTTFNCLDMLTFLQRRTCSMCFPGKAV